MLDSVKDADSASLLTQALDAGCVKILMNILSPQVADGGSRALAAQSEHAQLEHATVRARVPACPRALVRALPQAKLGSFTAPSGRASERLLREEKTEWGGAAHTHAAVKTAPFAHLG